MPLNWNFLSLPGVFPGQADPIVIIEKAQLLLKASNEYRSFIHIQTLTNMCWLSGTYISNSQFIHKKCLPLIKIFV
jgi:hypothetical protein